jgi:hypothetical protein
MDCQEWQAQDLKTGYQHFIDSLEKVIDKKKGGVIELRTKKTHIPCISPQYPYHIVTRCFGFDPTETQPDDTKGLIMIPDVGDKTFYMATLISDFTSEILAQFSILVSRISCLPIRILITTF